MVKLSIITVSFNSINFIEKCINNVISQNCSHLEHIIIDGGSLDGSVEIINQYANQYSHIRWISEKDKGQCDAMNKGIKMAYADYIGFLNVDDGYFPFTLKRIVDLISQNDQKRLICGNCKLIDTDGNLIYINRPTKLQAYHFYSQVEPYPINPIGYFYHKGIHNHPKVGLYNINNHFSMDYEFFLRICLYFPLIYFNEDWGYMLEHKEAKTTKDSDMVTDRKMKLFNEYYYSIPLKIKLLAKSYYYLKRLKLV